MFDVCTGLHKIRHIICCETSWQVSRHVSNFQHSDWTNDKYLRRTFKYSYGGLGNNLELVGFFFNADCVGNLSLESQLLDICGGVEVLSKTNYGYWFLHFKKLNILHIKNLLGS
jgi:hypothetical protein